MANLLIRNLDPALHAMLRQRAQRHRRSLEAEVRETLRTAIARDAGTTATSTLVDIAAGIFGPNGGIELEVPPRAGEAQRPPPDFTGHEYDR